MNVFLQFLHRITENELSRDHLKWCNAVKDKNGNIIDYKFDEKSYTDDLENEFIKLHIIKKTTSRSGKKKTFTKSRNMFIKDVGNYRWKISSRDRFAY